MGAVQNRSEIELDILRSTVFKRWRLNSDLDISYLPIFVTQSRSKRFTRIKPAAGNKNRYRDMEDLACKLPPYFTR